MLNFFRTFILLVAMVPLFSCQAEDAPEKYQAGKHYDVLTTAVHTTDPNKIEVVELFWYGCPHCYHFEPSLKPWVAALPADVNFVLMPAMWSDDMIIHAKIFYTAKQFNRLDKMHDGIFNAMQVERKHLVDEKEIAALFANYGIDEKTFSGTFNSFIVDSAVRQAADKAREYKMSGTPTLVINGKYTISAREGVSQPEMLNIANFLIDKERKAMKVSKK